MHIRSPLILATIVIACSTSIHQWHRADSRPPLQDEAIRLRASLHCLDDLQRPIAERFSSLALKSFDHSPPLLYFITLPFYLMAGTDRGAAGMINAFFVAVLILSIYGIGRRLYTETAGLIAAALTASYPAIVGLSKFYLADVPETAMAALVAYAALRAKAAPRPSWSVLLGLACGAGLLISWGFIIYFVGPLAYLLASSERKLISTSSLAARRRNLLFGAGAAALIAGPWYVIHLPEMTSALGGVRWGFPSATAFFKSLIFYPCAFIATLRLPMTLLFLAGLVAVLMRRKTILLPALWLLVPMALLLPVRQKTPLALTPVLPAAALLTAAGITMVRTAPVRRGLTWVAMVVGALNFIALNFGLPWGMGARVLAVPLLGRKCASCIKHAGETSHSRTTLRSIGPPRREDWALKDILSDVAALGEGTPERKAALGWFIAHHPRFNRYSLLYYIDQGKYPIEWARPDEAAFILSRLVTDRQRLQFDEWGKTWALLQEIRRYPLPDGSEAVLYRVSTSRRRHYEASNLPLDTGEKGV
ncbi:MAG: glycosyltransferase family 39 protein, partial [bacterium]